MFKNLFALSEQGVKDLKKGIISSFLADLSLMIPVNIFILLIGEMIKPLFNEQKSNINIWFYTIISIIGFILIYVFNYYKYENTFNAAYVESANRRISLAEKIRKLPLSFLERKDLSELTTTMMGDCTELEHTFSHAIPQAGGSILSILLVSICLMFFEWRMACAVFIVLPIAILILFGTKHIQNKYGLRKLKAKLEISDGIQEFIENIKELKSSGKDEEYLKKLDEKLDSVVNHSLKSELTTGICVSLAQAILKIGFATVILIGANLLSENQISFMTYLIFLIVASRIYDPLAVVFMQIADIFNSTIKIKRMKTIENESIQSGEENFILNNYDINFKDVNFSYENEQILKNVTFTAKQGEVTALVGPSGSGKSTVAKLAARFWDIESGKITIGNIDISTIDPEKLLKNYSIVFQDVVLFNGTIMENIRLGKRDASDEEVLMAAKIANCDNFVCKFEKKYNTIIGENGCTLSGGERQRISIARALLKDAPIILLDEATASLDVENETQIQNALSALIREKTVIVIAHRMRTILGADKIIVLDNGKVVEEGTPEKLIEKNGLFNKLVTLQKVSSNWSI
ncbi:ABC transporter ATP-binding protein [Clostridium botulinum]|uniref:ABC transporter ATP-binding protein n=1 Tax=Clostridium botulinum TaxID=1491 RepID=A0A6M0SX77_CLOBO|nr:ABC transporter ATP-binding protein [Clostridium botulinum]NFO10998.1 ABC transporter ATP-binding protein [Clostridium botulinum]